MDTRGELEAIERGALVRPMPELATIAVRGGERQSWLSGMVTCDVKPLRTAEGAYGLIVNKNGRILSEAWIAVDAEQILIGVRLELRAAVHEHLESYLVMEDAELELGDERSWWIAYGPNAEAVAKAARSIGGAAAMGRLAEIRIALLAIPRGVSPNLGEDLTASSGAVLATPRGWERIRLERMVPRFLVDFQAGCYPQEASLEDLAVSFDKGCYVGQEAVFMLEKRGHVSKRLVRLIVDAPLDVAAGSEVAAEDGTAVGAVTSAVSDEGRTFAMARLRYKHTISGTELVVAGHKAIVSCLSRRESCS